MKKLLSILMLIVMTVTITVFAAFPAASASVGAEARDSVVVIRVDFVDEDYWGEQHITQGTGFFVGAEGEAPQYLLTNQHVVDIFEFCGNGSRETVNWGNILVRLGEELDADSVLFGPKYNMTGRAKIRVFYDENTYEEAYPVESNELYDFSVLRLANPTQMRNSLPLTKPTDDMTGDDVVAVGYPGLSTNNLSLEATNKWSMSASTVNGGTFSRLYIETGTGRELIENDCDTKSGNSGGPLILKDTGGVIGLNTYAIFNYTDYNVETSHSAVSINNILPILDKNNIPYTLTDGSGSSSGGQVTDTDDSDSNDSDSNDSDSNNSNSNDNNTGKEDSKNDIEDVADKDVTEAPATEPAKESNSLNTGIIVLIIVLAVVVVGGAITAVVVVMNKNKKKQEAAIAEAKAVADAAAANAAKKAVKTPYIRSLAAQHGGARIKFTGEEIIMGRNGSCKIAFKEGTPGISGIHCSITFDSTTNDFILKDLKSTYGTFLQDGTKLTPNTPYRLKSGDRFYLGDKANILCVELE